MSAIGWVRNSLKAAADKLRREERQCRGRFSRDSETAALWREPSLAVADAYAEAAAVFERRISELSSPDPERQEVGK